MRRTVLIVAGVVMVAAGTIAGTAPSQATTGSASAQATASPHWTVTGSVVSGVKTSSPGRVLAFSFSVTNTGSAPADTIITYTSTNSTYVDIVCPLPSSHYNISPDTPSCEPGVLAPMKTAQSAIILGVGPAVGTMTVKACVGASAVPPGCKTLTVGVVG